MANVDAPFGFRLVGKVGSNINNVGRTEYRIAASEAAIYKGDPVEFDTTGSVAKADAASPLLGVFDGCFYTDPTTSKPSWSNYWPSNAATDAVAFVFDDPMALYEIQCDGTMALADLNLNADFIFTASPTTVNGQSVAEINSTTENTNATLPLKLLHLSTDPDNSDVSADNANWIVKINNHQLSGGTGTTGL